MKLGAWAMVGVIAALSVACGGHATTQDSPGVAPPEHEVTAPDGTGPAATDQNASPPGVQVNDLAVAFGRYYLAGLRYGTEGYFGVLLSSADGETWREDYVDRDFEMLGVEYGSDKLVALGRPFPSYDGRPGRGRSVVSDDGETMNATSVRAMNRQFAFGNDLFVAQMGNATMASRDGVDWSDIGQKAGDPSIYFAAGRFLRVTNSSLDVSDGKGAWREGEGVGQYDDHAFYLNVRALDDHFEALVDHDCCFGENPDGISFSLQTSTDGVDWSPLISGADNMPPLQILFSGPDFCVGSRWAYPYLFTGPDCNQLSADASEEVGDIEPNAVLRQGDLYLIGTTKGLLASHDGRNWKLSTSLP